MMYLYPPKSVNHSLLFLRFNIQSLKVRPILAWMSFAYKCMHSKVDSSILLNCLDILVPQITPPQGATFALKKSDTINVMSFRLLILLVILCLQFAICGLRSCSDLQAYSEVFHGSIYRPTKRNRCSLVF